MIRTALRLSGMQAPIEIVRNAHGKPFCPNCIFHFSLTHTEGLTAIAVGNREAGFDAERIKERNFDAIKSRLTPAEREENFFKLWTAKESYVKYRGESLATLLPTLIYEKGALHVGGAPLNIVLQHFELEGCTLCLCTKTEENVTFVKI